MRILVLDDDETLAHAIALSLQSRGFSVTVFHSPHDALRHLDGVDVLLTDFAMPGMTGLEVAQRAHAQGWRGALFLMSGKFPEAFRKHRYPGVRAVLDKPFPSQALLELIQELGTKASARSS